MTYKDPEKARAQGRRYMAENREKMKAWRVKWTAANREKLRATTAKWEAANREKIRDKETVARLRKGTLPRQQTGEYFLCQQCALAFYLRPSHIARRKDFFCSRECKTTYRKEHAS